MSSRESVRYSKSHESVRYSQSHNHDSVRQGNLDKHKRYSSEGVRFSDLSTDHLHRSKHGWDTQRRYYSADYEQQSTREKDDYSSKVRDRDLESHSSKTKERSRSDKERFQRKYERHERRRSSGRRSHSVDEHEDGADMRRYKSSRDTVRYDDEGGRRRSIKYSSRSKSHDSNNLILEKENQSVEKSKKNLEDYSEHYQAPFYLHTSNQSSSSHNGYERIQSLFYESTEQLSRKETLNIENVEENNIYYQRKESKDRSPRKRTESVSESYNDRKKSKDTDKSPKRRAAPAMPLPPGRFTNIFFVCFVLLISIFRLKLCLPRSITLITSMKRFQVRQT